MSYRGSFVQAGQMLAGKALHAMNSLLSVVRDLSIPVKIMFNLFDSYVVSILNYSCET